MGLMRDNATARPDLSAALSEHSGQEENMIGTKVFPAFPTTKDKATVPVVKRGNMTRNADTKRSIRGDYNRGDLKIGEVSFTCEQHGFEELLDDRERAVYEDQFDAELVASQAALNTVKIAQEIRIAALLLSTSTFTGSDLYTDRSGAAWATAASDVLLHVRAGKTKVYNNTGVEANALIISRNVREYLKSNTGIKDAVKYTKEMTDEALNQALAGLFGVKHVLVGRGVYNTSKKSHTFSGTQIWSDSYAMICRIAEDGKNLREPGIGRTFAFKNNPQGDVLIEQYREKAKDSDVFRAKQDTDEVICDEYFGHLLKIA